MTTTISVEVLLPEATMTDSRVKDFYDGLRPAAAAAREKIVVWLNQHSDAIIDRRAVHTQLKIIEQAFGEGMLTWIGTHTHDPENIPVLEIWDLMCETQETDQRTFDQTLVWELELIECTNERIAVRPENYRTLVARWKRARASALRARDADDGQGAYPGSDGQRSANATST